MNVNGTLVEAKLCTFTIECNILSSTSAPSRLTIVQVTNIALVETKGITVQETKIKNGLENSRKIRSNS